MPDLWILSLHVCEQEGKRGGEFFTLSCVVRTLVEVLQPFDDRVYELTQRKLIIEEGYD